MAAPRRFLAPDAAVSAEVRLDAAESHRLLRVLRLGPGARVEVFDGRGRAFAACFAGADGEGNCLLVRGAELPPREPPVRLTVGLAIPKGDGLTAIARQLAELGVTALIPLTTERSEGAASPSRLPRWRAAALSGTRQCGRALVPEICPPAAFGPWIGGSLPPQRWIASPTPPEGSPRSVRESLSPGAAGAAPSREELAEAAAKSAGTSSIVVLIGPEGGFSPAEFEAAAARRFRRLDLGERILRTGTAALVAAAAFVTRRR